MKRVWPLRSEGYPFDEWGPPLAATIEPGGSDPDTPWCSQVPDLSSLVRVGTDVDPMLGMLGPDAFLGPWADALDARVPSHRHALAMATAAAAFETGSGRTRPPFADWAQRQPRPSADLREALRAIDRSAWKVLSPESAPDAAWFLPGRPGVVLGRAVRGPEGGLVPLAFGFPADVPLEECRLQAAARCAEVSPHLDPVRRGGAAWVRYAYERVYLRTSESEGDG